MERHAGEYVERQTRPRPEMGGAGHPRHHLLLGHGQPAGVPGRVLGAPATEHDQLLPHVSGHRGFTRLSHSNACRHGCRALR